MLPVGLEWWIIGSVPVSVVVLTCCCCCGRRFVGKGGSAVAVLEIALSKRTKLYSASFSAISGLLGVTLTFNVDVFVDVFGSIGINVAF